MARAAVKAKQAQQAQAQAAAKPRRDRKHASGGNPNQDLFFSRLRRRQRWVFLALAVLFAVSFAALGVGSGTGGGLQQVWNSILGSSSDPVAQANNEIKTDPARGYKDLARAYQSQGNIPAAILTMQTWLKSKPGMHDAAGWELLGEYQLNQANTSFQQYQQVLQSGSLAAPSTGFTPVGDLSTALGTNPIDAYYQQQAQAQSQPLYQQASQAYNESVVAYKHAASSAKGTTARSTALQFLAQAAQYAGNTKAALSAWRQYLVLNPHTSLRSSIVARCQQLGGTKACKPKPVAAPTPPKK